MNAGALFQQRNPTVKARHLGRGLPERGADCHVGRRPSVHRHNLTKRRKGIPQTFPQGMERHDIRSLENKEVPVPLLCDEGLVGALPCLADPDFSGPVEKHQG